MRSRDQFAALLVLLAACDSSEPGATPSLQLAGASHAFGSVAVGGQSQPRRFTLSNTGDGPTGQLSASLSGANSGEFALVQDACSGSALSATATCTIDVQMRPTALGAKVATLAVQDGGGNGASVALAGSAASGGITMVTSLHDYGPTNTSSQSLPYAFVVQNSGPIAVGPLQSTLAGAQPGQFEIIGDTCEGLMLSASASCIVTIRFQPTSVGQSAATLTVSDGADAGTMATLRGEGGTAITLALEPASHDFGFAAPGSAQALVNVSVTNQSSVAGSRLTTRLTGANPSDFSIRADGCTGRVLEPGQSCPMQIAFVRLQPGAGTAALEVADLFGGVASMTLAGSGAGAPVLSGAPSELSFGSVGIGATSAAQSVTITNTGGGGSSSITTQLLDCDYYYGCTPSTVFELVNDGCAGVQLQPGGTCSISVAFKPSYRGGVYHQLTLTVENSSVTIGLTGEGVGITLTPDFIGFPATPRGTTSEVRYVVVLNSASAATGVLSTVIEPSGFAIASDGCAGTSLATGASCTIAVRFAPSNSGAHQAQLTVFGDPGGSAIATLSGTATP